MNREILAYRWFPTNKGTIGILITKNTQNKIRAYIGIGAGLDEEDDKNYIADWGSSFPLDVAKVLMPGAGIK